jgi:LysM repeat protein
VKRTLRALIACGLAALLLACGKNSTPATRTPVAGDQSAQVNDVVNRVEARASASEDLTAVASGYVLNAGGQIQTGEAASARLDFADGTIIRLAQESTLTLQGVNPGASPLKRLLLDIGAIWVNLTDGVLEVETPVGVASVRGSFAIIRYDPGDPDDPDDDLLVVDCLEGSCAVETDSTNVQMGNMERTVMSQQGQLRLTLTGADVQAFLQENPEARGLVETLTAAPPATGTPTPTATPTSPRPPTHTFTPVLTATPIVLVPSPSATRTSSATPAKATSTQAATMGRHVVRAGENLLCIARAYRVAPDAIAQANNLAAPDFLVTTGQTLIIPAVRWTNVTRGPVCTAQFNSPFVPTPTVPSPTPTPSATITPTPTATCEPGHFYDPFQKRCRPPESPVPPATSTPTITLTPSQTNTPLPTNTPTITPTPTQTDTPLPDTLGPSITMPGTIPSNVAGDGSTLCPVTFEATLSDPSTVASARIVWTTYNASGGFIATNNPSMSLFSGDTFNGVWRVSFDVSIPAGGKLVWDAVQAYDLPGNFQGINPGIEVLNLGTGDCP